MFWLLFSLTAAAAEPTWADTGAGDSGFAAEWDSGMVDGVSGATQTTNTPPPSQKKGCSTAGGAAHLGWAALLGLAAIRKRQR